MKTRLVQIGNSRGARIPKAYLERCGLHDYVELELRHDYLVIRPAIKPRSGWDDAFRSMREHGDDALLDGESQSATETGEREGQTVGSAPVTI